MSDQTPDQSPERADDELDGVRHARRLVRRVLWIAVPQLTLHGRAGARVVEFNLERAFGSVAEVASRIAE